MEPQRKAVLFFDAARTQHHLLWNTLERTTRQLVVAHSDAETLLRLSTDEFDALIVRAGPRGTNALPLLRRLALRDNPVPVLVLVDTLACTAARVARAEGAVVYTLNRLDAFDPPKMRQAIEEARLLWRVRREQARLAAAAPRPALRTRIRELFTRMKGGAAVPRTWTH